MRARALRTIRNARLLVGDSDVADADAGRRHGPRACREHVAAQPPARALSCTARAGGDGTPARGASASRVARIARRACCRAGVVSDREGERGGAGAGGRPEHAGDGQEPDGRRTNDEETARVDRRLAHPPSLLPHELGASRSHTNARPCPSGPCPAGDAPVCLWVWGAAWRGGARRRAAGGAKAQSVGQRTARAARPGLCGRFRFRG